MTSLAAERPIRSRTAGVPFAEAIFGFVARSHARACALLVVLSLACFLPGFVSLQPMDRDEPRYAQASKQMLETGDFVDIRFQNEARHKKPVGIYWLQAASVAAGEALGVPDARTAIALYRIPSLIGAIGDGAPDLLGRARLRRQARGVPRRGLRRRLGDPDGRGAAREDGRGARRLRGRRHGRARPRLFRARRGTASALDGADLLARGRGSACWSRARWCRCSPRLPCWRCPSASARRAGSWRCGPVSACSSCWRWRCPGSSRSP